MMAVVRLTVEVAIWAIGNFTSVTLPAPLGKDRASAVAICFLNVSNNTEACPTGQGEVRGLSRHQPRPGTHPHASIGLWPFEPSPGERLRLSLEESLLLGHEPGKASRELLGAAHSISMLSTAVRLWSG